MSNLTIDKIIYKNFFAAGNFPIEIDLSTIKTTLIVGKNGRGKSTIIDAICFALYGKTLKDVKKANILNSITKKGALCEIHFRLKGDNFIIKRGIKPDILEIYQNDQMLQQTATKAQQQEYIERYILRMNFASFKQIFVIGSGIFVPFMKLKAEERRNVFDNIFSMSVFTHMNTLFKDDVKEHKAEIESLDDQYKAIESAIKIEQNKKDFIERQKEEAEQDRSGKIKQIEADLENANKNINLLTDALEKLNDVKDKWTKVMNVKQKINESVSVCEHTINTLTKEKEFFEHNDNCPVCTQHIDENFKKSEISEKEAKIAGFYTKKDELKNNVEKLVETLEKLEKSSEKRLKISQNLDILLERKRNLLKTLENMTQKEQIFETTEIEKILLELDEAKTQLNALKAVQSDRKEMLSVAAVILKDSGIKARIIATYLPLINEFINNYLDMLDFYVEFHIDENFKEVIRSRYRDEFEYDSFSQGEKARIDLALLFTWRDIAKVRSNMSCNLLVLDEVFSGSLDAAGTDDLLKIFDNLKDTNIVVISHVTENIEDKFERVIEFTKPNNFSQMKVLR